MCACHHHVSRECTKFAKQRICRPLSFSSPPRQLHGAPYYRCSNENGRQLAASQRLLQFNLCEFTVRTNKHDNCESRRI